MSRSLTGKARWKPESRWRHAATAQGAIPCRDLIRFEGVEIDRYSGEPLGIFQIAGRVSDAPTTPAHVAAEMDLLLAWFNRHLPFPRRFSPWRDGQRRTSTGWWVREPIAISWFRADAIAAVRRARRIAELLNGLGVTVVARTTDRPGYITHADRMQVVAVRFRRPH